MSKRNTAPMDVKKVLKARKKEIEEKLKSLRPLEEELEEINKALEAMNPPGLQKCERNCPGCDWCRRGEEYR